MGRNGEAAGRLSGEKGDDRSLDNTENHSHNHTSSDNDSDGPLPPPSHPQQAVLSPEIFQEEPPSFDQAFAGANPAARHHSEQAQHPAPHRIVDGDPHSGTQPSLTAVAASLASKSVQAEVRPDLVAQPAAASPKRANSTRRQSGQWTASAAAAAMGRRGSSRRSSHTASASVSGAGGSAGRARAPSTTSVAKADGIGGMGRGTAATGDLLPYDDFESLQALREQVDELEHDYNARHSDAPLSGRIIHVSHYIPFVIRALAEVDFERRKEEQISATATVAAMAAAARARKAARQAEMEARAKEAEAEAARREALEAQTKGEDKSSTKASPNRKPSFAASGNTFTLFDGADIEKRLAENQARSRLRGGRRAWMMTPVVDDDDDDNNSDIMSEKDAYTPVGSRRPSRLSFSSRFSFSSMDGDTPAQRFHGAGISDFEPSPAATPPGVNQPAAPPQWVLAPRRGHTALNSGIRSLCSTHKQTYIGWPGDIHFAAQARQDERKEASETNPQERKEIEDVLASLDDTKNWSAQDAPVLGADPSISVDGAPPVRQVPVPLMNGADPIAGEGNVPAEAEHGIKYVPVWLESEVAHGHYEGYCKTTLWPLFHYLLWQDVPGDHRGWEDYSWEAYHAANVAFAQKIASEYRPGDLVWIHDYHLLLVPALLRQLVPSAHIGLFVHAPFPSSEIFRCLPKRREIVEGMLGADLACFQAFSYSRHFLSSCIRVCGYEATSTSIESSNGHVTHVSYNPIGIDASKIDKDSKASEVAPKIKAIREMYKDKKIIVGRDKLDVVRGVVQKLQAFHKFLEEWPEWRDRVVLIQITAPSLTDSPMLERKVSELVSTINGQFGSLNHTPCIHYHQQLLREEYFALLSVADMALITSVRDGMNTTSMEFVLANSNDAPLILSEFTGTAGRMRQALQVNPWNTFGVAKAIDYCLRMPRDQRKFRHDELHRQIVGHTSHHWAISLAKQLLLRLHSETTPHSTPALERDLLKQRFDGAKKRLLLLDYDGTMTPIVKDPEAALPSKLLLKALDNLTNDPRNIIYIISGRDERFLSKHLGHLQNMGFSAEHGGYIKEPGTDVWQNMTKDLDMSWMSEIRKVFEYYTERTSGSNIEQKKSSITWHYRNADPDYGLFQAKECQAHLDNFAAQEKFAIEVMVGKKNLEVRPLAVNKGEIVKRIVYDHPDAEFVFCAGDDRTDEDMMRFFCSLVPVNAEAPLLHSSPSANAGHANAPTGSCVASAEEQLSAPLVMTSPTPLSSKPHTPTNSGGEGAVSRAAAENGGAGREGGSDDLDDDDDGEPEFRTLALSQQGIFTTAVGAKGKKTLARWHLDGPQSVVAVLATMAGLDVDVAKEESEATEASTETDPASGAETADRTQES
ncbi:unnamed protein product [Parajaminaea phylloscopi]